MLNRTERRQAYHEVQEILATDLPNIFLYHRITVTAYNNDFHGFPENSCIDLLDPVILERVHYAPTLSCKGKPSIRVCLVDAHGNRSGYWNGSILTEIPGSEYVEDQEFVKIRFPSGNYTVEALGTSNCTYSLEAANMALDYKKTLVLSGVIREGQVRRYLVELAADGSVSSLDCAVDVDGDDDCDIFDIVMVCDAYGSEPGDSNWNVLIDIASPIDKVSIIDVVVFTSEYGRDW
jgi:hypothetical protein